jgi:hypothetical protein
MASTSWGSNASTSKTRYTDNWARSGVSLPSGPAMLNGSTAVLITHLYGWCAGRGATRDFTMYLDGHTSTGSFSVGAASAAVNTGWINCTDDLVNGGTANFYIDSVSGSFYYGTGGGGSVIDGYGTVQAGTLAGGATYIYAPAAPTALAVTHPTPTTAVATWTASAHFGDGVSAGYVLQRASNASFTTGLVSYVGATSGGSVTDLVPATDYFWRVCAQNQCTTAAGTYGPASSYTQTETPSGAYVSNGVTWPPGQVLVSIGGAWTPAQVLVSIGGVWTAAE